jgi:hypothetical protein
MSPAHIAVAVAAVLCWTVSTITGALLIGIMLV